MKDSHNDSDWNIEDMDGANLENQVKVRQQKIEQQEELIRILTKDLVTVCASSYEIIIKASIPGSEADEVAMHLQSCLAVLSKFTVEEKDEAKED